MLQQVGGVVAGVFTAAKSFDCVFCCCEALNRKFRCLPVCVCAPKCRTWPSDWFRPRYYVCVWRASGSGGECAGLLSAAFNIRQDRRGFLYFTTRWQCVADRARVQAAFLSTGTIVAGISGCGQYELESSYQRNVVVIAWR